jgi:Zn-dependent protease with chaperone function
MRKLAFFIWLVLLWYLILWLGGLGQTALVVILVAVPAVVASACYPNWRETEAAARELVGFWLVTSFLGVFPVFVKVFLWLYQESLLRVGELAGGLAGLAYFLVTLLSSVGQPLRAYFPGLPRDLSARPRCDALLAAVRQVAERSGARLRAVCAVPAGTLPRGPVEFAGLGTTNLYLSEEAVERVSPSEAAFLVGTELWHIRHRDIWWNLAIYYTWLVFVALHGVLTWAVVGVVGGVTFSVIWPLASRLKQLAADRYAARLTGDRGAALAALAKLPSLTPGVPPAPRGWRALARVLFSYEVPLGLRLLALWPVAPRTTGRPKSPELAAWRREGVRFLLLQVLLLLAVGALLIVPMSLYRRGILDEWAARALYLVIVVILYAPFTVYTLRIIYYTFLAPGEGAPRRRLPGWALAPALLLLALGTVAWVGGWSDWLLVELAMAVWAGLLAAGLVAGEIQVFRRGAVRAS